MPVVATLTVDLIAKTASFEGPLGKAAETGKRSAKDIQNSFNSMDFGEARGGLMLIDDLIGVHIPRHAAMFASKIPGLMQVAAAAMPVAAFAAIAMGILEATEKAKQHREEMDRDRLTMLDTAVAMGKHADSVQISNMKLADQIAILGRTLPKNAVKIAMEEGKAATDSLISALRTAIDQETTLLGKQEQGFFSKMLFGDDAGDIINKAKEYKVQIDALTSQLTVAKQQGSKQEIDAAQLALDTQLQSYKKFLNDKRAQDEKDRQKEVGDMRSQNQQIADSYTSRMTAAQKAKAAEANTAQNAQQEASINEKFAQRGTILNDLTILLNNYGRAQKAQAEHNALENTIANGKDVSQYNEAQIKKMVILEDAIKASSSMIDGQSNRNLKNIEKENAATIKAIDEQLALYKRIDDAQSRISTLTREISDQEVIQAQKMAIATGHMTEQQAVQQALKTLDKNKKDELDEINGRLERQLTITQQLETATSGGTSGTDDQKVQYAKAVAAYRDMETQKLQITKQFNAQIDAERLKAANNEQSQWRKMALEFGQLQQHMSQLARQTIGQMNSSIAAFVVTGTGNFRQLAVSAAESFITMGLEYVESKTIMLAIDALFGNNRDKDKEKAIASNVMLATSSAALAAAQTLALTSAVFLPPIPESLAAMAYGVGMGFSGLAMAERGAMLPDHDMLVHTHPQEMILPRPIANFVVDAASRASGSGGGGDTHNHFIFAPVIHAVDRTGVDSLLKNHGDRFVSHVVDHIRRQNY